MFLLKTLLLFLTYVFLLGAAVGPFLAGFVSGYGWYNVFIMLIISDLLALVLLLRLVKHEIKTVTHNHSRLE